MPSHKNGLVVSITPKRGLHVYFQKKASGFNQCVGDKLRNGSFSNREAVRQGFTSAARSCGTPGGRGKSRRKAPATAA